MPKITKGQDARSVAAQARAGQATANRRLEDSRAWYEGVRKDYSNVR